MRIGIVNDLAGIAKLLQRIVGLDPNNQVAWIAKSGPEAVELCARDTPDLILMDIVMPGMDGVETTRRIMACNPCAILIVTGSVRMTSRPIFEAMGFGALDAIDSPFLASGDMEVRAAPLLAKIATISRLVSDRRAPKRAVAPRTPSPARVHDRLIAIGASAGGPAVLATLLRELPSDFPAAVVIVQHVDEQFAAGMATWLNDITALPVRVAIEGDRPQIGEVLLASTGDHLTMKTPERVGYTADPLDYVYRPSVDVFFHSACRLWRGDVVGVLLTGMGRDGALGLKALRDHGHYTIAQDEATSAVYGMPKAAATINAAVAILPGGSIAAKLIGLLANQG
ncbi:MAG: chemotaxis response regulator protein-glutamate methylesterase [Acidobacteriota bacterium]